MTRYKLVYRDDHEFVDAEGPTEAVAARTREELPHTMTDMTLMASFGQRPAAMVAEPFNDDAPLRRWQPIAKEVS